ncbi:DUF1203 domain-containing protein [Pseudoalteromonas sp. JBTF-M23]|uniref:DUF1203 domain-containing protein n=1 Tax=Pseudoalteromonas caenipelagi TaxID=2726988 RepID=A0A849VFS9_9GAMM|nr:DUF1203 domain-containing protein [Pseudoalteromonas caenipelagi]NOU50754.1 DUF1203 domain-containing protein [Pseudoalteromonas caenipelagi]
MMSDFIIKPINLDLYLSLQTTSEECVGRWITADSNPGYPCRVSLREAKVGERVLLTHYLHHNVHSPYRASGPIFIIEDAKPADLGVNEIPEVLKTRLISLRAYSAKGDMLSAKIAQGKSVRQTLSELFNHKEVDYVQLHNANPGCFSCEARRV